MVGQLNEPGDKGDNQTDNTLNMITSLMGNMGNMSNVDSGAEGQPDLASLMQGMMKGLVNQQPSDLQIKE
jgi:hypothetical protein